VHDQKNTTADKTRAKGNQPMSEDVDARAAAWVCAWNAIQASGEIRNQFTKKHGDYKALPDIYWSTVAAAAVFADLARADTPTGVTAAALISEVETVTQAHPRRAQQRFRRRPEIC